MVLSIMNFVKLSLIMSCALWVHYPLLISSQLIFKASIMAAVDGNFFFFFWGGGGGEIWLKFHVNHLLAGDLHEISALISCQE